MNYRNHILAFGFALLTLSSAFPTAIKAQGLPVIPSRQIVNPMGFLPTVPTTNPALEAKEVGISIFGFSIPISWDGLAITIAKKFIERMVDSTVNWINSGFESNPAYVTDPRRYFTDLADGIAGNFIDGSDLNFLCSPFQTQVRLALQKQYVQLNPFQCTLTRVVGNIDAFYNDFSQGGWDGWFYMTQNNANNPYGSYLDAKIELDSRIASAIGIKNQQLDWGRGFLSFEKCPEGQELDPLAGTGDCKVAKIILTPGAVIEGQLQNVLGTGLRQLELADEFDELIGALLGQLLEKSVFSVEGLFSGHKVAQPPGGGGGDNGGTGIPAGVPFDFDGDGIIDALDNDGNGIIDGIHTFPNDPMDVCLFGGGVGGGNRPDDSKDPPCRVSGEAGYGSQLQCTNLGQAEQDFMLPLLLSGTSPQDVTNRVNDEFNLWNTNDQAKYNSSNNRITLLEFYVTGPTWNVFLTCGENRGDGGGSGGGGTGTGGTAAITGTLDPALATIVNAPAGVASWPETTQITSVDFSGSWKFNFSKKDGAGRWPDQYGGPGVASNNTIQYTVWLFLKINGQWVGSGFIQVWYGRTDSEGGPGDPYVQLPQNWYYASRWAPMTGHVLQKGEQVGFMVTSGNSREGGVPAFKERSNIVLVTLNGGTSEGGGSQSFSSLLSDVKEELGKYPASAFVNCSGTGTEPTSCPSGYILNAVAWKNRNAGWGLSGKTSAHQCPSPAGQIACDILHYKPTNALYDVFTGSGGSQALWIYAGPPPSTGRPWVAPVAP